MTAAGFLTTFLNPGLAWMSSVLGPVPTVNDGVRVYMLAVAGQESGWQNVQQSGDGEGMDPFQQQENDCVDILSNPATSLMASRLCAAAGLPPDASTVYANLLKNPTLAVGFARLNMYADPNPIPAIGDQDGALECYRREWNPGDFAPDRWPSNYQQSVDAVIKEQADDDESADGSE